MFDEFAVIHGRDKVRFGQFGLDVTERLVAPDDIDLSQSLMRPYVDGLLLPRELDVLCLDPTWLHLLNLDLSGTAYLINQGWDYGPPAWYLSVNHPEPNAALKAINKQFGLSLKQALVFPSIGQIDYSAFVHEVFHAIFDNFDESTANSLIDAAERSYPNVHELLSATPIGAENFDWPEEIRAQARARNAEHKSIDGLDILSNLPAHEQRRCVEEVIAYSFTSLPDWRFSPIGSMKGPFQPPVRFINEPLKGVMRDIGYNVDNSPMLVHPFLYLPEEAQRRFM